jgi:ATP-binding cassette subfamily F protein uup
MAFMMGCEKIGLGVNDGRPHRHRRAQRRRQVHPARLLAQELRARYQGTVTWRRGVSVGMLGQTTLSTIRTPSSTSGGRRPNTSGHPTRAPARIIDELIEATSTTGKVGDLSGGQRRRVDLARVLIGHVGRPADGRAHQPPRHACHLLAGRHLKRRWRDGRRRALVVTHDRWFLDEVCTEHVGGARRRVDAVRGRLLRLYPAARRARAPGGRAEERRQNMLQARSSPGCRAAPGPLDQAEVPRRGGQELIADDPPLRDTIELKRLSAMRAWASRSSR